MRVKFLLMSAVLAASPAAAAPDFAPAVKADYDRDLGKLFDHFHRNPELSFREFKTAARMAAELREVPGVTVTEKVGGTGVVGVLKNGAGPTVLVRADMDGLPVEEKSGLAYAANGVRQIGVDGVEVPVMHACGHDVHITSLIGTARRLAAMKDRWKGTVVFVVQPAEERVGGARDDRRRPLHALSQARLRTPEPAIRLGTEAMTIAVLELLGPSRTAAR